MPNRNLSQTTAIMGEKAEKIVIFAVINNVKVYQHKTKKRQYMASSVRIKYKKIEKNGENLSENIFVIVNTNTVDGDLQFNIQYLDIRLEEIAEKNKNISLADIRGNKIRSTDI